MQTKKTEKACRGIDTLVLKDIYDIIAWHGSYIIPDIPMNVEYTCHIVLQFIFVLHLIFIQFPVPYFLNKEIKTRKFYNMFQFYLIKVKILGTLCQSLCFTFHSKNLIDIFKVIMVIKNYRPQKGLIFFFY